jgi:hypothetical protein
VSDDVGKNCNVHQRAWSRLQPLYQITQCEQKAAYKADKKRIVLLTFRENEKTDQSSKDENHADDEGHFFWCVQTHNKLLSFSRVSGVVN